MTGVVVMLHSLMGMVTSFMRMNTVVFLAMMIFRHMSK